jgi:RNA polymerase sigma-70 factor (ECF subfamily)
MATDEDLIRRFVEARDERAFRDLYARHSPAVYGLLRRLSGTAASDADDVLQEAWLRAATIMSRFRGESAFRTWLTGVALNCYRERRRHARTSGEASDVPWREPETLPVDRALDVTNVLSCMSAAHREVLVLHDVEGYTHDEIADALGIESGTSKSRLSRARQVFRDRWLQSPEPRLQS